MRKALDLVRTVGLLGVLATSVVYAAPADQRVADAAQRRDLPTVRALIRDHVDVNAPQGDGTTALAWAAHWDDVEMADVLLKAGARANVSTELGVTPLYLAAENGSPRMVTKLLDAAADAKVAL